MSILGTRVARTEDSRLVTGGGNYVDNLREPALEGAVHVTFVRSPIAHARITGYDLAEAREAPGVVAVLTGEDVDLPAVPVMPELAGAPPVMAQPHLARGAVRYVGEPVAVVVTETRYQGEDAAELVGVDYDPLPTLVDVDDAVRGDTLIYGEAGTNVVWRVGGELDDNLFDGCEVVVTRRLDNQRLAPAPLEVRGAACAWGDDGRLTMWLSTQNPQPARDAIVAQLGLESGTVRVVAPDVGGGFGAKSGVDPEPVLLGWLARRLGRPLRWVESRSESMVAMTHGRAQRQTVTIGGGRDGTVRAYRLEAVQDCGAYPRIGAFLPFLTGLMAPGVYTIGKVEFAATCVVTNTTPTAAYRGAGRPEATAAIERAMDLFAAEIGMDPAEVRRRNLVPADAFPYTTAAGAVYDTGDYVAALDAVLEAADYPGLRAEQARRREAGAEQQLGIGLSAYAEITAPDNPLGEHARVEVHADGTVTVFTGSSAHGQGHATSFAMLVADQLGVPMERITVVHGDTDRVPEGVGTHGSRSLQLGGSAIHSATRDVIEAARKLAAELIEADEQDLVLDTASGSWHVRGAPGTAVTWAQVAERAEGNGGLAADAQFIEDRPTFPFGVHLSVVEVDVDTGMAALTRHVTVDDAGRVLNPVLTEGQRHGGIAQGAAQALFEHMAYDADGNPLTSTFADYAFVGPPELPSFELLAMETETPLNPLGAKGIGEAGTIGSTPAVQNAVVDAVAHLGVRHIDMPTGPQRVWAAVRAAAG
ncbi:MAG: xanthine dehydrogenase family protein molybdopterin-binding subunit [Carbonactinosporaceae bacterium]